MGARLESVRLVVEGIELVGFHGCTDAERTKGNCFRIDLELEGKFEKVTSSDRLEDSIDYRKIVSTVRGINRTRQYFLIESFADAIANGLLARFPKILRILVRVQKLSPPGLGKVACAAIELIKERR
ncbi:dihydroneopterin aldolase [Candidatus Bipolaricaulota bacterium]|nr:dihydroneopterin aldolase [Candidatus Bipolaricaulota bacterium]